MGTGPGYDFWVRFLADSPIPEYQTLSKRAIFPKDWDVYDQWTVEFVIEKGTHTFLGSYLTAWEKTLGRYWKGEKLDGDYPYGGYLSDKNWHLNEELTEHMLRFQQAGLICRKLFWENWEWGDDDLNPETKLELE